MVPAPAEGAAGGEAAAWAAEVALVERIISHLVNRDSVIVVVQVPEVRPL